MQCRFQQDQECKRHIELFSALAFVPVKDVLNRFAKVNQLISSDLKPLAQYFEYTYVGTATSEPLFSISFWNVYDRVKYNVPRTSNFIEGWHNKFQKLLKTHAPTMWKFFFCMLTEQNNTENVFQKLNSGERQLNLEY